MKFQPLQDRILIRRIEADAKTPGGLYIPETAKEKPIEGEVVAVGPGRYVVEGAPIGSGGTFIEPRIKAGDRVLFGKYSGTEIRIDGIEHLVVREEDVLGVIS
jgi:chaperonin GroES